MAICHYQHLNFCANLASTSGFVEIRKWWGESGFSLSVSLFLQVAHRRVGRVPSFDLIIITVVPGIISNDDEEKQSSRSIGPERPDSTMLSVYFGVKHLQRVLRLR